MTIDKFLNEVGINFKFSYENSSWYGTRKSKKVKADYTYNTYYGSQSNSQHVILFTTSYSNCGLLYVDNILTLHNALPYNYTTNLGKAMYEFLRKGPENSEERIFLSNMYVAYILYKMYESIRYDKSECFNKNLLFIHLGISGNENTYYNDKYFNFFKSLFQCHMVTPKNKNSDHHQLHGIIDTCFLEKFVSGQIPKSVFDKLEAYGYKKT